MLCDVSGSVANFAQFTLLLVFALRDQFQKVRAFTFVDHVHEVTEHFRPGADVADVMADLAASTAHAALLGPHQLRPRVHEVRRGAPPTRSGPRPRCWCWATPAPTTATCAAGTLRELAGSARHAGGSTPSTRGTGTPATRPRRRTREIVPMVECRNLTQLGEFVHDIL